MASLILAAGLSYGQSIKLAGIEYANYPKVAVKGSQTGQELAFREFGTYINVPIIAKKSRMIFVNGFRYFQLNTTTYNSPIYSQPEVKQTFHTIIYSLNVVKPLSPKWTMILGVLPTISSDFTKGLTSDDFLIQALALAHYKLREGFEVGGGLAYNTRFGRQILLPIIQVNYQKRLFHLNAILPTNLNAYFRTPNERLKAGLRIRTIGSFININDQIISNNTIDKLSYTRINVGPLVEWKLAGPLVMELAGGITARRKFDFSTAEKNTVSFDSESGPFLTIGLSIAPTRKKESGQGLIE